MKYTNIAASNIGQLTRSVVWADNLIAEIAYASQIVCLVAVDVRGEILTATAAWWFN